MNLDDLEKQVSFWNKAAMIVPIFFTTIIVSGWLFQFYQLQTLFFIACGLYFTTAVIWWWWTMKSVNLLVNVLKKTAQGIETVSKELKIIRSEIHIDQSSKL